MTYQEKIELMERMKLLINRKATGNSKAFARKLGISERTLYYLLNQMKEMGAPIYYNKHRCCYCLEYEVEFVIGFVPIENINKIKGGEKATFFEKINRLQLFLQ